MAKRALLFAISKQIIPACDAQYRPVSRGWFAIWFAIRGLKPLRKGRRPKPTRQSPLPSKVWQLGDVARYATSLILGKHLRHVGVIRVIA